MLGMFLGFAAGAVFASYAQASCLTTCRRVEVVWGKQGIDVSLLVVGSSLNRSLEIAS